MGEDRRCKVALVTEMPEIEIRDGHMYFHVLSGGKWSSEAYPLNLIVRINREVERQIAEHFASLGEVVPLRD